MITITRFILLSTVIFLDTFAFAQAPAAPAAPGTVAVQSYRPLTEELELERRRSCTSTVATAQAAFGKARTACSAAGTTWDKCVEKATECIEANTTEADGDAVLNNTISSIFTGLGINTPSMSMGQYRGQCMNRKDHREQLNETNRNLEKAEDKVSQIQKDITKAQEDAERDKRRANEALQDLMRNSREEDVKSASESRTQSEQAQADSVKIASEVRNLRIAILQDQGQLANTIGQRTSTLAKLSNAAIQTNCMENLEKLRDAQQALRAGSANTIMQNSRERRRRLEAGFQACIKEMMTLREATRESTARNIEAIEQQIAEKQERIKGLEQALSLRNQNMATQAAEQLQSKSQAGQERTNRMQILMNEQQTIDAATRQRVQTFSTDLQKSQMRMNKYSNELASLGSSPAGEKSPQEAQGAIDEARTASAACQGCTNCPNVDSTSTTGTPAVPAPGGPRPSTPAVRGTDGL
ncbi:MAG: hypothetical protein ACK5P7_00550 [Bdellovibrio sp.]|jgi:hypothetical protein